MNTKIKFLLASLFMVSLMTSCMVCKEGMNNDRNAQYEECGFGDEVMLDEVKPEVETAHTTPAADRRTNPTVFDEVVEDKSFASESNKDQKLNKKNKRTVKQLGSKKKMRIKDVVKVVKEAKKKNQRDDVLMTVLLVILALILPPLAVGIYEGITGRFWLVLVLWLIGWGVGWWLLGPLAWLASLVAVIMALLIVLGVW
jgi:uncharacterized membrane protein YqaE (UPF0057 family)